jgi:hypothetical protein
MPAIPWRWRILALWVLYNHAQKLSKLYVWLMSAKTAKKGRVYQSAKSRQRQGMAGIVRARKHARSSERVDFITSVLHVFEKILVFCGSKRYPSLRNPANEELCSVFLLSSFS